MDSKSIIVNDQEGKGTNGPSSKVIKQSKKTNLASDREWDEETDKKLLSLVKIYGSKRWKQIGRLMKRKTATCIRRFSCYLKPGK